MTDMRSRTPGGVIAFADYLAEKGYQGKGAVTAWKTAVTKVFQVTGGDDWESATLDGVDLDELATRFHTLTGNTYKAESVAVYKRRIQLAMEAQAYFIENGRPPSFKKSAPRKAKAKAETPEPAKTDAEQTTLNTDGNGGSAGAGAPQQDTGDGMFDFAYPLSPGRIVHMRLPMAMSKREIDRLCAVLQTLEEQPQIAEHSA